MRNNPMPNPAESAAPFGRKPRDWVILWRFIVVVFAAIAAAGGSVLLFAGKAYVKEAAGEQMAAVMALPARVEILEADRARQDRDQRTTAAAVNAIQQDVAAIKATQEANARTAERSTERILKRLDELADRR